MKKSLGFIPARKGSKGVPGKNTRLLSGKPLIAYTIEAALHVPNMELFVSTDDPEVIAIAQSYGIGTEYLRPSLFATDTASMLDVIVHGLDWFSKEREVPENFVLLQPTSPFRETDDINAALALLESTDAFSVLGVSRMWNHPQECIEINGENWKYLLSSESTPSRRQEYSDSFYFINGSIYCMKTSSYLEYRKAIRHDSRFLIMDENNSIDIDTERDWIIAEALKDKLNK